MTDLDVTLEQRTGAPDGFVGQTQKYFSDLKRYRSFCLHLVGAALRARFRRSRLGILWAVLQPLAFAAMIAAVWSAMFDRPLLAFAMYVYAGMIVWECVSQTIAGALNALTASEGYLKQTRIPFFVFQARVALTNIVIFTCGLVGLVIVLPLLGQMPMPGWHLLLAPLFYPLLLLFITPLAIIFSVLGTQFRDVHHITTIALQALFFLSPVLLDRAYLDRPQLAWLPWANPLVPLLDMFRAPLIDGTGWRWLDLGIVGLWIVLLWTLALAMARLFGRRLVFAL